MTNRPLFVLVAALLLLSVPALAGGPFAADYAGPIEKAHGLDAWNAQSAFESGITVHFGGQKALDGKLITDPPGGKIRLEAVDGTVVVLNPEGVFQSPADSAFQGARFHILTWPYFIAAPMKLRDPGTHLKDLGKLPLNDGEKMPAARLTFDDGVGDTPDDWYVLYRDGKNRLAGMAYIVTFGKDLEAAEKEPHAITYHDFQDVDGVAVPTRWQFWNWSQEKGIEGDPIGEVELRDPRFVQPGPDTFATPAGANEVPAPPQG